MEIWQLGMDCRLAFLADADIDRSVFVQRGPQGKAHFSGVAGGKNAHTGQRTHDGHVFEGVVGGSQLGIGKARTRTHDDDRSLVIAGVHTNLLEAARSGERRDGVDHGPQA
jgi:hypothetical protein